MNELIDLYYNSKFTIKGLLEKFSITNMKRSEIYKHFPPAVSKDLICKYCGINMIQDRKSRSVASWVSNDFYCLECGHINRDDCKCKNCESELKQIREAELQKKRAFILERVNRNVISTSYKELTFTQRVYLGALLRAGIKSDYDKIKTFDSFEHKLSPSFKFDEKIFLELFFHGIIQFDLSSLDYYTVDINNDTLSFEWERVPLILNIGEEENRDSIINELLNPNYISNLNSEALDIWKDINYWECIELYKFRMSAYEFEHNIGKDIEGFFKSMIEKLPVSQIFYIIWSAAKSSAADCYEGRLSSSQIRTVNKKSIDNDLDYQELYSLDPSDHVLPSYGEYVFWKCQEYGELYRARVREKVDGSATCPYCSGRKAVPGVNSLEVLYPEIAMELHEEVYNADNILPTLTSRLEWKCQTYGLPYMATVKGLVDGTESCPYCAERQAVPGVTSFKALYLDIAEKFDDPAYNPDKILPSFAVRVQWRCKVHGLPFYATVRGMVDGTENCPYCLERKAVPGVNLLKALYPDLIEEEWKFISNILLANPDEILPTNSQQFFWQCSKCGTTYKASPKARVQNIQRGIDSCPSCKGLR